MVTHPMRVGPGAVMVLLLVGQLGGPSVAHAEEPAPASAHAAAEAAIQTLRERGQVFELGKGRYVTYVALRPETNNPAIIAYYGDGKTWWPLSTTGTGAYVARSSDGAVRDGHFDFEDQRYALSRVKIGLEPTVACGKRSASLRKVTTGTTLLAKAVFKRAPGFVRISYFLARDDGTSYFYLDRGPVREGANTDFQIHAGKRGAMKPLRIKDLAWDAAGDVFVTVKGTLRMTASKQRSLFDPAIVSGTWTATGKRPVDLVVIPIDRDLVHAGLGVYFGQRFETPCDDL